MRFSIFLAILALPFCAVAQDKLNVVFFLVDDLGYMDIGANNPDCFYETPNIDKLAASGVRFTDGYAANPVCSPTRYSIMTGKHPSRIDATNFFSGKRSGKFNSAPLFDRMPLSEVTIAEAMKEAGYATFFAGKWHLGPTAEFWPTKQGFDVNVGGHKGGGPYGGKKYFSPYGNPRMQDGTAGEHLPQRLANDAAAFIKSNKDKGFFTYLSFYSVHTPLIGRPDLVKKYKEKAAKQQDGGESFADEEQVWGKGKRRVRVKQNHAVYAAMVEAMDAAVGTVMQALEDSDQRKNTIVFFTSDNGGLSTSEGSPTSNVPLRGGKGWVYEGGIREAFLVSWPGVTKPGAVSAVPVVSTDFYPTILDAAGLPARPQQHLDGVSLVPLLKGGTIAKRDLFWHYPHYSNQGGIPSGALRDGDFKLIERYEDGRVHLYNLKDDIGERTDLAEKMPDRVKAMRSRLHAWYKDVDAKFLQPKGNGPKPWAP
jgi:arylsulfatase A-like enzyme